MSEFRSPAPTRARPGASGCLPDTESQDAGRLRSDIEAVSLEQARCEAVDALARTLELHDYRRGRFGETVAHCERVTGLALLLARSVAPQLAADRRLEHGFRLHDIGMIGVSDSILQKTGTLSPAELDELREHPLLGERIVAPMSFLGPLARQVVGAHHERFDGSGYPRHLEGSEIPLPARIFALADAYDAMTSARPHRAALPDTVALEEIERQAGGRFDPGLARAFARLLREPTAPA